MAVSGHKYVIVLGSCCTGDALRSSSYEAIATTKLRLLLYQGRTSFPSLTSGGLANDEYSLTAEGVQAAKTEWGFRMAVDEAIKQNAAAIAELVNIADALIVDHVSTFLFPTLVDSREARYFVRSWEWDRYIDVQPALDEKRLWELPLPMVLASFREILTSYYQSKPDLALIFHLPKPAFNDGVSFADASTRSHVDYYHRFCDTVYASVAGWFPRVSAVCPASPLADPAHPNGPNPFHFDSSYPGALQKALETSLGVS